MKHLKILFLEDSAYDVEEVRLALRNAGISFESYSVDKQKEFQQALNDFQPDLLVSGQVEKEFFLNKMVSTESMMKEAEKMANFGSWQTDLVTGANSWSDQSFRIYGYEPNEVEPGYDLFLRHVHPEDLHFLKEAFDQVGSVPGFHEFEFRIIDKFGTEKNMYSKILAQLNEQGKPIRLVGFTQDITERKEAEQKLLRSFQEVAGLEKNLAKMQLLHQKAITEIAIQAQEKERKELAGELHDNINQLLATVKLYLEMIQTKDKAPLGLTKKCRSYIIQAMTEIRKLSHSLAAPTLGDIGLKTAVQQLVDDVRLAGKLSFELDIDIGDDHQLDKNLELILYRILQEQINNIIKHARADKVHITMRIEESFLYLCISDNGVGFEPAETYHGVGLRSMNSRVEFYEGQFKINSGRGRGCTLEIKIPVSNRVT